jgi:translation elongation factor EF-4
MLLIILFPGDGWTAIRRRHHAQTQASGEGRQEDMRQFGKVDIPQEAFMRR